jgi:hypothetical protein
VLASPYGEMKKSPPCATNGEDVRMLTGGGAVGVAAKAVAGPVSAIAAAPMTSVTAPISICSHRCNPLRGALVDVS